MFNSVDCNDMIVLTCFLCVHVQGDVQGKDTDASMTAFCLIAMQESRTICNDTVNVSTSPPYSVLFCYDQKPWCNMKTRLRSSCSPSTTSSITIFANVLSFLQSAIPVRHIPQGRAPGFEGSF